MIGAYYKRLTSPDRKVMNVAAKIWSAWEGSTIHLQPDPRTVASFKSLITPPLSPGSSATTS